MLNFAESRTVTETKVLFLCSIRSGTGISQTPKIGASAFCSHFRESTQDKSLSEQKSGGRRVQTACSDQQSVLEEPNYPFKLCGYEKQQQYTLYYPPPTSDEHHKQSQQKALVMSGARHSRSSLMSHDDEDDTGRSSHDYPSREFYSQHAPPYQPRTATARSRQASLKPPPQAANRASLIDDDSDENDQDDPYQNIRRSGAGFGGSSIVRGNLADFASQPKPATGNWGTSVPPSAASMTNGRRTMPGINYGMEIPPDDFGMALPPNGHMGQHKERKAFLPEQPVRPVTHTTFMQQELNRKAPPTLSAYPPKDPPGQHRPAAPIDFSDTIARLTAQIDQPDEETLMTQHAQKTLMEIQHTTSGRDLIQNPVNDDIAIPTRTTLPKLSEPRKQVSTIFSRRIQKPLEPNTKSTQLRRPSIREATVDVMVGLANGSITTLDQRITCLSCGDTLVSAKAVIIVICPKCSDAHPNHRVIHSAR